MSAIEAKRAGSARQRISASLIRSPTAPIWSAGILIRLLCLPFLAHPDLYRVYSRAHEAVTTGNWFAWDSQLVIQLVHNVWLLLVLPLLPADSGIWSHYAGVTGIDIQPEELQRFLDYPYLPRALFLLKLPYALADLGIGLLLVRLAPDNARRWVLALWLLNPLTIYTSVVWARHDSLGILLMVASLYAAARGRRFLGLGLLGAGAAARFFPAFLAPFFVLAYRRSRRELALFVAGLTGVWLMLEMAGWLLAGSSPTLTILNRYQHVEYLVALGLPLDLFDQLFFFPLAYLLLVLWFLHQDPHGTLDYLAGGQAAILLLFGLTFFHPQYAIWLVPLLALISAHDRRLLGYHAVQIGLIFLYTAQFGSGGLWGVLRPLGSHALKEIPEPQNIIASQVPIDLFTGIVRSLFTAVTLWMAFLILRRQFTVRSPFEPVVGSPNGVARDE